MKKTTQKATQKATLTTTQKPGTRDRFRLTPTQMKQVIGGAGVVFTAAGDATHYRR